MTQYFIHDGQNEKGPFDIEQLKIKDLKKETPIWFEGLDTWTTVGEIEELKNLIKATPPPLVKKETVTQSATNYSAENIYSPENYNFQPTRQKSNFILYIIAGIIILGGIIGWLIYQNNNLEKRTQTQESERVKQDSVLNDVKTEIARKKDEEKQKEIQLLASEQEKQAEKDRINGVITEKYMGFRNNWRNYIAASVNGFSTSDIGGISDLAILVYNQTDKSIDEIQLKVDYIKKNGSIFKTELVSITNIGPNSEKSVSAPASERGTSVNVAIESISAKSFHFCYPNGMDGNKDLDPYFCK